MECVHVLRKSLKFAFPSLAQIGFPQGDPEPAQRLWENAFQECWKGGKPFLGDEDGALSSDGRGFSSTTA